MNIHTAAVTQAAQKPAAAYGNRAPGIMWTGSFFMATEA
jgi:hypothetical protein